MRKTILLTIVGLLLAACGKSHKETRSGSDELFVAVSGDGPTVHGVTIEWKTNNIPKTNVFYVTISGLTNIWRVEVKDTNTLGGGRLEAICSIGATVWTEEEWKNTTMYELGNK